jgi:hypothetical protein
MEGLLRLPEGWITHQAVPAILPMNLKNAYADYQVLAHIEVHGRNARKKFGEVSFWFCLGR